MIFADQKSIYGKVKVIDDITTLPYYCRMQTYKSYQLFIFLHTSYHTEIKGFGIASSFSFKLKHL